MAKESSVSSSLLPNALGSAAAGILSRICTHPLDTIKARLQAPPGSTLHNYQGPWDALQRTARTEGIRGLYRGFGAVIVGGTPGTVLYLCTYDVTKLILSNAAGSGEDHFLVHFASGMVAETIACIIYVPVDVIKERMQVQHTGVSSATAHSTYNNTWDALKKIAKTEGLSGIYKGYAATLASFGPFSALYFVFYERFKWRTQQHLQLERPNDIPFQWTVLNSASAGALASWITSPLDMAKLRLQVQRGERYAGNATSGYANNQVPYSGFIECLQRSFREGGVRALFRGAGARVLHFAPATTVTMTTYETCRSFISHALNDDD
jgi:Mitochondrial carrier protein